LAKRKPIGKKEFQRGEHVYQLPDEFVELIKDAIRFCNGTPVYPYPLPKFSGPGVYLIYCVASTGIYRQFGETNRTEYRVPIYVGKAVPQGWRKGRSSASSNTNALSHRMNEHRLNIANCESLDLDDFACRFVIMENDASDMIGALESALIRQYNPLWNTVVDGFGNHTPGKGRWDQAKSEWDVLHPGRDWAEKCKGKAVSKRTVVAKVKKYMDGLA
jgi:hypothetical protein